MRKLLLLAIVISLGCNAQELGLLVDTESRTYLIGEPIEVSTRVHNRTTRTFTPRRGNEAAHLSITVMRGESRSHVEPHGRELHLADIDLPSSEVWQGQVEITRLFNLRNEGRYLIRLIAVHDGMRYESFPRTVEIVAGFEITKVEQVFPAIPHTSGSFVSHIGSATRWRSCFCRSLKNRRPDNGVHIHWAR